eukprot:6172859-Pleurochrysis_carterae.AAC.4
MEGAQGTRHGSKARSEHLSSKMRARFVNNRSASRHGKRRRVLTFRVASDRASTQQAGKCPTVRPPNVSACDAQ